MNVQVHISMLGNTVSDATITSLSIGTATLGIIALSQLAGKEATAACRDQQWDAASEVSTVSPWGYSRSANQCTQPRTAISYLNSILTTK